MHFSRALVPLALLTFSLQAAQSNAPARIASQGVVPMGLVIPDSARRELEAGVAELAKEIEFLDQSIKSDRLRALLPDVQIYHKAVDYALRYQEFFQTNEIKTARLLLQQGKERARLLGAGDPSWTSATGLVVRGYRSRIDGSIQPYGLVVPDRDKKPHRLDLWFHGRDDKLTELKFIDERQRKAGEFTPAGALVLHLYGRYCNASKFAGETDMFEALEAVKQHYPIDENRIGVRGFSMGGATTWHVATHHAGLWAAAAPGAGFAESREYLKLPKPGQPLPWYEEELWHLYNATDYAGNLFHCPTLAYSGEIDKQKQAADIMARAMAVEGLTLRHLIGPNTEHKYEPQTKVQLAREFDTLMQQGRDPLPREIRFTTWTLRYPTLRWVTVDGLETHWQRARVQAERSSNAVAVLTTNVSALTLTLPAKALEPAAKPAVTLDGQLLKNSGTWHTNGEWVGHFRKTRGQWKSVKSTEPKGLAKRPGLQGPIDDAFMESFLFVAPSAPSRHPRVEQWVAAELARATNEWRSQFRGEAVVRLDKEISEGDLAAHNLVLWGDPESNLLLARLLKKLPIGWTAREVRLGGKTFSAENHVPVYIFPNPLNPKKYVVLNSGFTFRAPGSNANQTPKLPDYAVVNLDTPASLNGPGAIVAAGFFNEDWALPKK